MCLFSSSVYGLLPTSRVCDPGRLSVADYTGFRVEHQGVFDTSLSPISSSVHITLCKEGHPISDIVYEYASGDGIFPWNKTLCANDSNCYRLARSKENIVRPTSMFNTFPSESVGAIFELKAQETSEGEQNYVPISRLYQSSMLHLWFDVDQARDRIIAHYPFYYTSDAKGYGEIFGSKDDDDEYFSHISAIENYKFEPKIEGFIERANNEVKDKISSFISGYNKRFSSVMSKLQVNVPSIGGASPDAVVDIQRAVKRRKASWFPRIFKSKIERLSKFKGKISLKDLNFETMIVLSKMLPVYKYEELLKSIDEAYNKIPLKQEIFKYPKFSKKTS